MGGRLMQIAEYRAWCNIKTRCYNSKWFGYQHYGGRGIRVCRRWLRSYTAFLEDMGPRPSAGHSIERRDNNGHYEPANCYWAPRTVQVRNTRRTVWVTLPDGTQQVLLDFARANQLDYVRLSKDVRHGADPLTWRDHRPST